MTVSATETKFSDLTRMPDARGHFGPYGGRFVSETLSYALEELEQAYRQDQDELAASLYPPLPGLIAQTQASLQHHFLHCSAEKS